MNATRRNVIAVVALVAVLAAIRLAVGSHSHRAAEDAATTAEAAVPVENIAIADSIKKKAQIDDSIKASKASKADSKKRKPARRPPSRNYLDDAIRPSDN